MKVIEIMKLGRIFLELLQESCIKIDDLRFVSLYDEYSDIVNNGGKTSYAVAMLSDKYKISERKVYYIIKKFSKDCNIGAVG